MIDITMTATRRHEILEKTLESFKRNLFENINPRLIINIDPVGPDENSEKCINVCLRYFKEVVVNLPKTPNFSRAFIWTWSQTISPFVFHLEDDWELLRPISLFFMIDLLNKYKDLALLRLPQFKSTHEMKNWNLFFPWNGEFFECPENLRKLAGFCGHPSLIKKQFIHNTYPLIDSSLNPEKQFHQDPRLIREVLKWRYGVFSKQNTPNILQDLGRVWLRDSEWQKRGDKGYFIEWEKK